MSEESAQADLLRSGRLTGTYLLTSIRIRNALGAETDYVASLAYAKSLEYSLLLFFADGTCQRLQHGVLEQGRYALQGTELRFLADTFRQFKLGRQSMSMRLTRPINGQPVELYYKAYRLNLSTDALRFQALIKAAFTHPTQPETDVQIRERVKSSLYFYSLFFRTIHTNQFNQFKPAAISLPIRFYNGGIRVPNRFDSTASWTSVYATTRDAETAHEFYRRAANAVKKYPNGDNFIHEYSLVLAKMAETL